MLHVISSSLINIISNVDYQSNDKCQRNRFSISIFTTATASFKIQDTTYSHATNNGIVYKLPIVNMIFQLKLSSKLSFSKYLIYVIFITNIL